MGQHGIGQPAIKRPSNVTLTFAFMKPPHDTTCPYGTGDPRLEIESSALIRHPGEPRLVEQRLYLEHRRIGGDALRGRPFIVDGIGYSFQ